METSIKRMIGRLDVPADLGQVLRDEGLPPCRRPAPGLGHDWVIDAQV